MNSYKAQRGSPAERRRPVVFEPEHRGMPCSNALASESRPYPFWRALNCVPAYLPRSVNAAPPKVRAPRQRAVDARQLACAAATEGFCPTIRAEN